MQTTKQPDYRAYIGEILAERARKNPRLSLRSMARHLGISPSTLSEVLGSKKNISEDRLHELIDRLKLTRKEASYLTALYEFNKAKLDQRRKTALEKLNRLGHRKKIHDLSVDKFKLISEWYYPAICELARISKINLSPSLISKALQISIPEAREAIEVLKRLDIFTETDGKLHLTTANEILVESSHTNEGLQKFYKQMLERVQTSLEEQSPSERLTRTETLAFDASQLPLVEEAIEDCIQRILEIARSSESQTAVYHLFTQFFKVTKGKIK